MVFWSFWVLCSILVHQKSKFELNGQFCFSRHPWGPWGHQSSGVIWNETKISWFGHCDIARMFSLWYSQYRVHLYEFQKSKTSNSRGIVNTFSPLDCDFEKKCYLYSRLSIVPGLFQFSSPGTFRVSRSCPARTTGPSRSLGPVLPGPRDLGPFVPGVLPGPRDQNFFCMLLHFFGLFCRCITIPVCLLCYDAPFLVCVTQVELYMYTYATQQTTRCV